jgi:hypothetical protein
MQYTKFRIVGGPASGISFLKCCIKFNDDDKDLSASCGYRNDKMETFL